MAHLVWQDDLSISIQVINNRYKRIIEMINHLHDAQQSREHATVAETVEELAGYTLSHFAFEETLMEDTSYQFSQAHRKIHKLFIRQVPEYRVRFQAGENVDDELKGLLLRWLFNHIRNDDAGCVGAVRHSMSGLVKGKSEGDWLSCSMKRFFGRPPGKEAQDQPSGTGSFASGPGLSRSGWGIRYGQLCCRGIHRASPK